MLLRNYIHDRYHHHLICWHRKPESLPADEHQRKISGKQNNHMIENVNKSYHTGAVDTVRSLLMDRSGLNNPEKRERLTQNNADSSNTSDYSTTASSSNSYVLDTTTATTTSVLNSSTLSGSTADAKGKFSRLQKLYEKIVNK